MGVVTCEVADAIARYDLEGRRGHEFRGQTLLGTYRQTNSMLNLHRSDTATSKVIKRNLEVVSPKKIERN